MIVSATTTTSSSSKLSLLVQNPSSLEQAHANDDGGATISASDSTAAEEEEPAHEQQPSSSMTRQLNQSLGAWTAMGQIMNRIGQQTIRLGAEEVESRVREREYDNNNDTEQEPQAKRYRKVSAGTSYSDDDENESTTASPELMADAEQIRRMAILYAHMRDAHELFRRELENFVDKAETRAEEEQIQKTSQETNLSAKAE